MAERSFEDVALQLHPTDNVAVLKQPLVPGDEIIKASLRLLLTQRIRPGHKIALSKIPDAAPVRKYGQIIGFAQGDIVPGAHVHTHNLRLKDFGRACE